MYKINFDAYDLWTKQKRISTAKKKQNEEMEMKVFFVIMFYIFNKFVQFCGFASFHFTILPARFVVQTYTVDGIKE